MKIADICRDYFNFCDAKSSNIHIKNSIIALKLASYFTIVIPLIFAAVYGISSLAERIRRNQQPTPQDQKIIDQATKHIKPSDTQPRNDTALPVPEKVPTPSIPGSIDPKIDRATKRIKPSDTQPRNDKAPPVPEKVPTPSIPGSIDPEYDIRGSEWLRDNQIRYFFRHLAKNRTGLYYGLPVSNASSLDSLKTWVKRLFDPNRRGYYKETDWILTDATPIIAFPFSHSNTHWTLILIDRNKRTVEYYDSLLTYGDHQGTKEFLIQLANTLTTVLDKDDQKPPYQFIPKLSKKLQLDTYQCGVWTGYFLEKRLENPDVDFNQLDINASQQMIADYRNYMMDGMIASKNKNVS